MAKARDDRWVKRLLLLLLLSSSIRGFQPPDTVDAEKTPAKAVLTSLIPGGGQIYNGKYLKAVVIFSAEAYAIYQFLRYRDLYGRRDRLEPETSPYMRYREKRNKFAWWAGFVYVYNLLDALVDSHLATFDEDEIEEMESGPGIPPEPAETGASH
ncbi:MAG: DUF5683 domain-containing protein [Fidelibacterota bacterium]